jgi:hypothetical protein
MTKATVRGYTVALSLLGFTGAWAAVAHDPFPAKPASTEASMPATDPRVVALSRREALLRRRAKEVRKIVAARTREAARAPVVRIVSLPAVTVTTTS